LRPLNIPPILLARVGVLSPAPPMENRLVLMKRIAFRQPAHGSCVR
jgi:hypothetical protein